MDIRKYLVLSSMLGLLTTPLSLSKEIPSGKEIKGEIVEKGEQFVKVKVDHPPFCKGYRTFSVVKAIKIPPKGSKIKAHFEKNGTCDEESPVINKIEVLSDEKD